MPVDPQLFKRVMGLFATGISVVTTKLDDAPMGLTVNTLTSISLEPRLVLISITRDSVPATTLAAAGRFSASILSVEQESISNTFATAPMEERFQRVPMEETSSGLLIVKDCMAYLEASIVKTIDTGDHTIFIGEVTDMGVPNPEASPLLYFKSEYGLYTPSGRGIS